MAGTRHSVIIVIAATLAAAPHRALAQSGSRPGEGRQELTTLAATPNVTGTWTYFCEVHPNEMQGATIVVQ